MRSSPSKATLIGSIQKRFTSFHEATGMGIRLVQIGITEAHRATVSSENPFCRLLSAKGPEDKLCAAMQECLSRSGQPMTEVRRCLAGMVHVTVPVIRNGLHLANLESGQAFWRSPTEADFRRALERHPGWLKGEELPQLKRAYFRTPVVAARRFDAGVKLLDLLAESIDLSALSQAARDVGQSNRLKRACAFITNNLSEPLTSRGVAQHVKLCPAYFCRSFKKKTGRTFVQYLTQARVERAKSLLRSCSHPITEIGYAAGFQSIWHFNHTFKALTGQTPTEFRQAGAQMSETVAP